MGGRIVPVVVVVVVGSEMMSRFLSKDSKTGRLSVDMYQHQVCHLSGHLPLNTRHQDEAVALGTSECVLLDPPPSFTQVVSNRTMLVTIWDSPL